MERNQKNLQSFENIFDFEPHFAHNDTNNETFWWFWATVSVSICISYLISSTDFAHLVFKSLIGLWNTFDFKAFGKKKSLFEWFIFGHKKVFWYSVFCLDDAVSALFSIFLLPHHRESQSCLHSENRCSDATQPF